MSGWAAIYGGIMAQSARIKREKNNPNVTAEKLTMWTTWESVTGKLRVDFSENDQEFVSSIQVGDSTIRHEGIDFNLIDTYFRSNTGRV